MSTTNTDFCHLICDNIISLPNKDGRELRVIRKLAKYVASQTSTTHLKCKGVSISVIVKSWGIKLECHTGLLRQFCNDVIDNALKLLYKIIY